MTTSRPVLCPQLEQAAADTALLSLKQEPIAVSTLHLASHHLPEAERAAITAHRSMFVIKVQFQCQFQCQFLPTGRMQLMILISNIDCSQYL